MAIKSIEENKTGSMEKELKVTIDNGDLKLIDSLVDSYSFKDRDSLLKFAVATLLRGNNEGGIYTIKEGIDGKKFVDPILPSDDLVEKESTD